MRWPTTGSSPRSWTGSIANSSTPALSIIFAAILTGIIQVLFPFFPNVVLLASITTLIPYAAASVSLAILRKSPQSGVADHFRLPAGMIFAFLGFVLSSVLIYWATWPLTLVGVILTLIGFPLVLVHEEQEDGVAQAGMVVGLRIGADSDIVHRRYELRHFRHPAYSRPAWVPTFTVRHSGRRGVFSVDILLGLQGQCRKGR